MIRSFKKIFVSVIYGALLVDLCQAKERPFDIEYCRPSLEIYKTVDLSQIERWLAEERASSDPRADRIERWTKHISTRSPLDAVAYAAPEFTAQGHEYLGNLDIKDLKHFTSKSRSMLAALLANDLDAYRSIKGVKPRTPEEVDYHKAQGAAIFCQLIARTLQKNGKLFNSNDKELLSKVLADLKGPNSPVSTSAGGQSAATPSPIRARENNEEQQKSTAALCSRKGFAARRPFEGLPSPDVLDAFRHQIKADLAEIAVFESDPVCTNFSEEFRIRVKDVRASMRSREEYIERELRLRAGSNRSGSDCRAGNPYLPKNTCQ